MSVSLFHHSHCSFFIYLLIFDSDHVCQSVHLEELFMRRNLSEKEDHYVSLFIIHTVHTYLSIIFDSDHVCQSVQNSQCSYLNIGSSLILIMYVKSVHFSHCRLIIYLFIFDSDHVCQSVHHSHCSYGNMLIFDSDHYVSLTHLSHCSPYLSAHL
ncbi:unnamed protein product [Acanthosepion pharaonis]|uniref:Uncharacterized protein n=1 Tax=Acanthosepion pharaonis TaxID=158019 RepID=A0A812D6M2_ACAPH|nr:unnamed protein product [Sepia pharaonis]